MRSLGDVYVKDEFRRHRAVTNPLHIVGFLGEWKTYLDQIETSVGERGSAAGAATTGEGSTEKSKRYYGGRRLSQQEFEKVRL